MYKSTKTYGHDIGLSCAFRQWKSQSHCSKIHGYALAVKLVFTADELDVRNWVVDFGSLKSLKGFLEDMLDHKLLVAQDDPQKEYLLNLVQLQVADVVIIENVGCESFAKLVYDYTEIWLHDNGYTPRVSLESVEVMEHGANSAIYTGGGL